MKKIIIVFAILLCGISAMKAQEQKPSKDSVIAYCKKEITKANADFIFEGRVLARYSYWDKVSRKQCTSSKIQIHKIIKGEDKLKHGTIELYWDEKTKCKDTLFGEYKPQTGITVCQLFFCSKSKEVLRKSPTIDSMQLDNTIRVQSKIGYLLCGGKTETTQWDFVDYYPYFKTPTKEFYKLMDLNVSRKEERYVRRMDRKWLKRFEQEEGLDTSGAYKRKKRADSIAVEMKTFVQNYSQKAKRSSNEPSLRFKIENWYFESNVSLSSSIPTYLDRTVILLRYNDAFYKNTIAKNKFEIHLLNELKDSIHYSYSLIPSDYDENTIMITLIHKGGKRILLDTAYKNLFWFEFKRKYMPEKDDILSIDKDITLRNSFYTTSDTTSNFDNVFQYQNIEGVGIGKKRGTTELRIDGIDHFDGNDKPMKWVRAGCEDYIVIRGEDFGTTKGLITFVDASKDLVEENVPAYFDCRGDDIIEWTNSRIKVKPPTYLLNPIIERDKSHVAGSGNVNITTSAGTKPLFPKEVAIYGSFKNRKDGTSKVRDLPTNQDCVATVNDSDYSKIGFLPEGLSEDEKTIVRIALDALSCRLPLELSYLDTELSGYKPIAWEDLGSTAIMNSENGIKINLLKKSDIGVNMPYSKTKRMDFYCTFLHELGHLLGLNHVNTKGNIMYPVAYATDRNRMELLDNEQGKKYFIDLIKEELNLSASEAISSTERIILKPQPFDTYVDFSVKNTANWVFFNDSTLNGKHSFWEFGDKNADTLLNTKHEYIKKDAYTIYHSARNQAGYCQYKPIYKKIELSDKCSFKILQAEYEGSCVAQVGLEKEQGFAAKYEWVITKNKKDTLSIEKIVPCYSSPVKSIRIIGTTGREYGLFLRAYKNTTDKTPSFVSNVVKLDFISATCGDQLQTELYTESLKQN